MRSIRLSLLVYFLALLGLALGAVSVLVYQTTYQTLLAKKQTTEQLLRAQYEERRQEENAKLDNALSAQVWNLASLAQFQFQWTRAVRGQELAPLGLFTVQAGPNAHLLAPIWIGQALRKDGSRCPFADYVLHASASEIQFKEEALLREVDDQVTEYFQINS